MAHVNGVKSVKKQGVTGPKLFVAFLALLQAKNVQRLVRRAAKSSEARSLARKLSRLASRMSRKLQRKPRRRRRLAGAILHRL